MVRIPAYVVVIASFVTLLQMVMQAYVPGLYATLGLFIPLIVVNCILLGRAEAFAAKNGAIPSFFDGLGMGLGFTIALTILGGRARVFWVRENSSASPSCPRTTACSSSCLLPEHLSPWVISSPS